MKLTGYTLGTLGALLAWLLVRKPTSGPDELIVEDPGVNPPVTFSHDSEFEKPAYDMERRVLKAMHLKLRGIDFGV